MPCPFSVFMVCFPGISQVICEVVTNTSVTMVAAMESNV